MEESEFLVRRDFEVSRNAALGENLPTRFVSHYHFMGWKDWQLPAGGSRGHLETLVESAANYVKDNSAKSGDERKRLLVHCRAGIGRSGTTLALI